MERQTNASSKAVVLKDQKICSQTAAKDSTDLSTRIEMAKNVANENNHQDSLNLVEPPPLDWRSDSSSEACSLKDLDDSETFPVNPLSDEISPFKSQSTESTPTEVEDLNMNDSITTENLDRGVRQDDLDHTHIQTLLTQLQLFHPTAPHKEPLQRQPEERTFDAESHVSSCTAHEISAHPGSSEGSITAGLLFTESHQKDLLQLLEDPEPEEPQSPERHQNSESHIGDISELTDCQTRYVRQTGEADEMISVSYGPDIWHNHFQGEFMMSGYSEEDMMERWQQSEGVSSDELASHSANVVGELSFTIINVTIHKTEYLVRFMILSS